MRIYSLSSNMFSNSCQTDSAEELAKYIMELAKKAPDRAIFSIRVEDIPTDIWLGMPVFEGFKPIGENDGPEGS